MVVLTERQITLLDQMAQKFQISFNEALRRVLDEKIEEDQVIGVNDRVTNDQLLGIRKRGK